MITDTLGVLSTKSKSHGTNGVSILQYFGRHTRKVLTFSFYSTIDTKTYTFRKMALTLQEKHFTSDLIFDIIYITKEVPSLEQK